MAGKKLQSFMWSGQLRPVNFVQDMQVLRGVSCSVYEFVGDDSRDLGIITIDPGCRTPLQKVIGGDETIEGYISGRGTLMIITPDGVQKVFRVSEDTVQPFTYSVETGQTMQWQSDNDSRLTVFEICTPPYRDGRFLNISE